MLFPLVSQLWAYIAPAAASSINARASFMFGK
jgi:hypothetical protein